MLKVKKPKKPTLKQLEAAVRKGQYVEILPNGDLKIRMRGKRTNPKLAAVILAASKEKQ